MDDYNHKFEFSRLDREQFKLSYHQYTRRGSCLIGQNKAVVLSALLTGKRTKHATIWLLPGRSIPR
jgi:hypothetical protein